MEQAEFFINLGLLGIHSQTLSWQERETLDEKGYLLIHNVLSEKQVISYRQLFETSYAHKKLEGSKEKGTRHVVDGFGISDIYSHMFGYDKLLAAAAYILKRPFLSSSLHGREPLKDFGLQGLHADWGISESSNPYHVVNSIWYLDDASTNNGTTRIVPGSHLYRGQSLNLMKEYIAPHKHHPKEILVEAPAGSVLIFNGHLFHSGTQNSSGKKRRVYICGYTAAEHTLPHSFEKQMLQSIPANMKFLFNKDASIFE